MIIDFHTHIFTDELAPRAREKLSHGVHGFIEPHTDMTASGLLASMDSSGVDISVIQPIITKQSQTVKVNEWAAGVCSDRLISFGGIYPHTDDWKRDIDFVASLGLRGLKFHAEYQNFVLDSPEMLKIYDYAMSRGLIIMHHAGVDEGMPPPYKSSPAQFAHIADEMQGGVLIAAHLGGHRQWDEVEKHLPGKNIYIDTSMGFGYYSQEQFLRIAEKMGTERLLFASDSPWSDTASEIAALKATPLSDNDKMLILSGNARKLLSL